MKKKWIKKEAETSKLVALTACLCIGTLVTGCKGKENCKNNDNETITQEAITPTPETVSVEPTNAPNTVPYAVFFNDQLYSYKGDIDVIENADTDLVPIGEITQRQSADKDPDRNDQTNVGCLLPALLLGDTNDYNTIIMEANMEAGNHSCNKQYMKFEAVPDDYTKEVMKEADAKRQQYIDLRSETGEHVNEVVKLLTVPVPVESYEADYAPNQPDVFQITYHTTKNLLHSFDMLQQSEVKQQMFRNFAILFATNKNIYRCRIYLTDGETKWAYDYERREMGFLFGKEDEADIYECSKTQESITSFFKRLDKLVSDDLLNDVSNINSTMMPLTTLDQKQIVNLKDAMDLRNKESLPIIEEDDQDPNKYYLLEDSKHYKLYGSKDYKKMILTDGKEYTSLDFFYNSSYSAKPKFYEGDFDGDGTNELVIQLGIAHGTGFYVETLLMIEPEEKMCYELSSEQYEKELRGHMGESIDEENSMQLLIDGKAYGEKYEKPSADDSNDRFNAGDQIFFDIKDDKIVMDAAIDIILKGYVTGEYFDDGISMEVNYEGSGKWSFGKASYKKN